MRRTDRPSVRQSRRPRAEFVPTGYGPVHLRRSGNPDARPLLLVHGFAGSLHWYDLLAEILADHYHLVCVDLRGHGHTGGDTHLDSPDQGRMLAEALDFLELTEVTAVGHSFGADVVLAAAASSARITGLVVIDQAPDLDGARYPFGSQLLAHRLLGPILHRLAIAPFIELGLRYGVGPGFDIETGFPERGQAVRDHRAMSPVMARTVLVERRARLAARPLDQQIRELALPTLVIHGRNDRFYDWETTSARYRRAGAHVEIIEDAGHSPTIEQPAQVARSIHSFMQGAPASEPPR
ncbi:alpha/beta fold hydrolase [Nocardia shimofusensis]|uniref:alpha/beta fold hydrolase n=1 Tax=Nocardia shimofusensis TaxID=228596 RepID=UPI000A06821D|nr:alpha/beta hydrolase [Nocardia shimofusensis]